MVSLVHRGRLDPQVLRDHKVQQETQDHKVWQGQMDLLDQ